MTTPIMLGMSAIKHIPQETCQELNQNSVDSLRIDIHNLECVV